MMVELNKDIIKVINDVNKVLIKSPFHINRFEVGSTGAGGEVIDIDIRRHKTEEDVICVDSASGEGK